MSPRKPARAVDARTRKTLAREELFVASFLVHQNASQAARDAGYSEKTAYAKGNELLKRPTVIAAIAKSRTKIVRKFRVTAERVVEEMAVIGFSSIENYRLNDDGFLQLVDGAPEGAVRAVKKFKRKLRLIPQKQLGDTVLPPIREIESEFELWSKDSELRALGDYLAMFKEKRDLGDTEDDENLTTEQRRERVISLLRVASKRRKEGKRVS